MGVRVGPDLTAFTGISTSPNAPTGKLSPWNPDDVDGLLIHFTFPLQISIITHSPAHTLVLVFLLLLGCGDCFIFK